MFAVGQYGETKQVLRSRQAVVLIAPPGAGKSFLLGAKDLSCFERYSSGDWCRREMDVQSELGKAIAPYVNAGDLIPNELYQELIRRHVSIGFTGNLLALDGLIRSKDQEAIIEKLLPGYTVRYVLVDTPLKVCRQRMLQARKRTGETGAVVSNRFRIYKQHTLPLVRQYKQRQGLDKLIQLNGLATREENAQILLGIMRLQLPIYEVNKESSSVMAMLRA